LPYPDWLALGFIPVERFPFQVHDRRYKYAALFYAVDHSVGRLKTGHVVKTTILSGPSNQDRNGPEIQKEPFRIIQIFGRDRANARK
jgi:hypothetical protein